MQSALATAGVPAANQLGDATAAKAENLFKNKKKARSDQTQNSHLDGKAVNKATADDGSQEAAEGTSTEVNEFFTSMAASSASEAVEASALRQSPSLKAKAGKRSLPSGDDLGDEFPIEIEDAEDVGTKRKKKKATSNPGTDFNAASPAKVKKSKHKVVSF